MLMVVAALWFASTHIPQDKRIGFTLIPSLSKVKVALRLLFIRLSFGKFNTIDGCRLYTLSQTIINTSLHEETSWSSLKSLIFFGFL